MTIEKADRRFKPERAQWAGNIPKHTPEAAAIRQAATKKRLIPLGPAIRNGLRVTTLGKRDYSAQQRRDLAAKGEARPGGRFPIANARDLKNALSRWADASPADRAYIRRRAAQLGVSLSGTAFTGSGSHGSGDAGGRKVFAEQHAIGKSAFGVIDERLAKASGDDHPGRRAAVVAGAAGAGALATGHAFRALPAARRATRAARAWREIADVNGMPSSARMADRFDSAARGARQRVRRSAGLGAGLGAVGVGAGLSAPRSPSVAKAYTPGEITYHQQQADLHARKKTSSDRGVKVGVASMGAAAGVAGAAHRFAPDIARLATSHPVGDEILRNTARIRRGGSLAGLGLAAGGAALAGGSLSRRAFHAERQNAETRKAQAARRRRNASVAKADTVGDARRAEAAQTRKKVGLGTAGVGYLLASRGKDVAPGAADLITRSEKRIGRVRHDEVVARRAKKIGRASGKLGAATVIGGLGLGAEGLVADIRHRHLVGHTKDTAKELLGKADRRSSHRAVGGAVAAGGVAGVVGGVKLSRVADVRQAAGVRRAKSGRETFNVNADRLIGGGRVHGNEEDFMRRGESDIRAGLKTARRAKHLGRLGGAAALLGAGTAYGGLAYMGGAGRPVSKAFDPERSRHNRSAAYEGAASGGAVVAAAAGTEAARRARERGAASRRAAGSAADNRVKGEQRLIRMASRGNGSMPRTDNNLRGTINAFNNAKTQGQRAEELAGKATRLRRIAGGSFAGSALLGAAALGIHHHDRRGAGRTYGY